MTEARAWIHAAMHAHQRDDGGSLGRRFSVEMRAAAGVSSYRLFIWLSVTVSVTHSGVCLRVCVFACEGLGEENKRE